MSVLTTRAQLLCIGAAVLLWSPCISAVAYKDTIEVRDLSGVWMFHPGDSFVFKDPLIDDIDWDQRCVPTNRARWPQRWRGYGWYRVHLTLEHQTAQHDLMLSLGPAREVVEVYLNGSLVATRGEFGSRQMGGARYKYLLANLPASALRQGDNLIAVRVYDPSWTGGIPEGPILVGLPRDVEEEISAINRWAPRLRTTLAIVALLLGLLQLFIHVGRGNQKDHWLQAAAGLCLAIYHFGGTGILTGVLPNLAFAVRLPIVAGMLAVLSLSSFFVARYDDFGSRPVRVVRNVLFVLIAAILLLPDAAVFFAAQPLFFVSALLATLYSAHLLSRAARRRERGTIPLFACLVGLLTLLVLDGVTTNRSDMIPPLSTMGAVFVLGMSVVLGTRLSNREHDEAVHEMQRLKKRVDGRIAMSELDSATTAITRPRFFLNAVIHDVARRLQVRRCSLLLERDDGKLYVNAAVGLPKHALAGAITNPRSVAAWVHREGKPVTSESLPQELRGLKGEKSYVTDAFMAHPIRANGMTIGVLNATDRNDGGSFDEAEAALLARVAAQIAEVLTRLQITGDLAFVDAPEQTGNDGELPPVPSDRMGEALHSTQVDATAVKDATSAGQTDEHAESKTTRDRIDTDEQPATGSAAKGGGNGADSDPWGSVNDSHKGDTDSGSHALLSRADADDDKPRGDN